MNVTHGRTYARSDGRESLGLQRLRRETKNPLGTFPAPIQVLPNCQVSEKLDERARRYFRTHVRTYVRTHGRDSLGL